MKPMGTSAPKRWGFNVKLAIPLADLVKAEADARGLKWAEYISIVVARAHGLKAALPARKETVPEQISINLHLPPQPQPEELPVRRGPGRPGRGKRHPFGVHLVLPLADLVKAEGDARGIPWAEYIAIIVAQEHGLDTPLPERKEPVPEQASLLKQLSA